MNQVKICLFFLFFQVSVQSQTKHYYQISGGLGITKEQETSIFGSTENALGGRLGALYCYQKNSLGFKTGLSSMVMGEKIDFSRDTKFFHPVDLEVAQNNYFLEIPLLLHFNFRQKSKFTPYGEIGLAANAFLRSKATAFIASTGKKIEDNGKTNNNYSALFTSYPTFIPSFILNLGLQYEYKTDGFFFIQPSFTLMKTKYRARQSSKQLFSLDIGVRYGI